LHELFQNIQEILESDIEENKLLTDLQKSLAEFMSVTGLQESIELDSDSDEYFTLLFLMPGGVLQND
jgi:hypothetical protein